MSVLEIDLKNKENLENDDFKEFADLTKDWYKEASKELNDDVKYAKFCKLYLVKNDSDEIIGGVIISNIQNEKYDNIESKEYNKFLELTEKGYDYLMWFYVKKEYRKQGVGNELMNHVLEKHPKLSLETENDSLVKHYNKFGFKELIRNYNKENLIFMIN